MKAGTKVLLCSLVASVAINIFFVLVPIVRDQFAITSSLLTARSICLFEHCAKEGALPVVLPKGEDEKLHAGKDEILYERLDDHHATLRSHVCRSFPFITTYIGCDVHIDDKILRDYRQCSDR